MAIVPKASNDGGSDAHVPALDTLRALAILMVLGFHASFELPTAISRSLAGGMYGVDLFFVLSGFLITNGLLRSKKSDQPYFRSFYWRRILRIFPVYYGTLVAIFIVLPHFLPIELPPNPDRKWYYLFLSNWALVRAQLVPNVGQFWSLAVEEQFYLIWPLVVYFASPKTVGRIAAAAICVAPGLRALLILEHIDRQLIYRNTFCRMDALMAGALCAVLIGEPKVRQFLVQNSISGFVVTVGLALCVYVGWGPRGDHVLPIVIGLSANAILFGIAVISAAVPGTVFHRLSWKPFKYIAAWSYGMYAYHLAIFSVIVLIFPRVKGYGRATMEVLLTILIAALSYELVEKKILRLKNAPFRREVRCPVPVPPTGRFSERKSSLRADG